MTSPILLIAGRFLLASALLMALYWVVWRKQATYRAKRMYLLTMPIVALAISLLQVEVYKPEPVVVEVSGPSGLSSSGLNGPSPIPSQGRGVDTAPIINSPIENETNNATLSEGQGISLPPLGEGKGWGPWSPWNLTLLLYALIILLFCIPFVVNLLLVRRLRKEASIAEEEKEADIRILTGKGIQAPFSFHRTIFLPTNLTETQRRMILAHEEAHILHRHYLDVWVAEAVTRLLWWNPFLWWARAELRNVHEFEADSNVLATGEDVYAYQAILIEEVLHGDIVIANGFNHSFIRRRFVEMLQSTNRRMTSRAKAGTTAWMLLVVALMCCTVGEAETVYKVKSDELRATSDKLQVMSDGAFNVGPKVVRFNNPNVAEKELAKRDSLLWAHAHSIPVDFSIHTRMKSEEEQKLFERFMMIWSIIVDHNGWLERGEIPTHESLTEEEERNGIVKAKEHYRELLMQTLSQIDVPLHDTLNLFLEKFGTDFVLPKGKGFTVLYKKPNGEPKFYGRPEQKEETAPADSGQWYQAKSVNPREYLPEVLSQIGNLDADAVVQLLSTAASVQELTPEQYEELKKTMPNKNLPSLDSINSNAREIKKAIETIMLEGMTGMQTAIVNNIREAALKPGEVVNVPMTTFEESFDTTFTVEALWTEEVVIDTSYQAQNDALLRFIAEWFDLSENAVHLSESGFDEKYKDFPKDFTYEDYNKGWNGTIVLQINFMSKWLNKLNSELRPQVEALLKQHGWVIPRDKEFPIIIESKAFNKTWTFVKKPRSSQIIPSMKVTEEELTQMKIAAKRNKAATNTSANESSITNDASLREQDEALRAFFRGWFDMNKMSQTPILTKKEFQQAIKTEPIPPGFDPSYKAYKERIKNNIAEAEKKMEEARARLNKEIRPQVEAVLNRNGKTFPPERQLKIIIRAAYKNATWEFKNTTHPNAYGCAVNTNFMIVDDPSSPDYQ